MNNSKAIDKKIASIGKTATGLRETIQAVGLEVLAHIDAHGEVTLVNKLYAAVGDGAFRQALATWLLAYGKVNANMNKDTKADKPFVFAKAKMTDLESAAGMPWWKAAKQPDPVKVFDLSAQLAAFIRKAEAEAGKGNIKVTGDDPSEALNSLKRVLGAIAATV